MPGSEAPTIKKYKADHIDLNKASFAEIAESAPIFAVDKFSYDVVFATSQYHLVRNRKNKWNREDSLTILPNRSTVSDTKLPRVKMNLQTNRPPNLVQLSEARLLNINEDPKVLSSIKKVPQVDFKKQVRGSRSKCLINHDNSIGMQRYNVKDDYFKKRIAGVENFDKQLDYNQIMEPGGKEIGPGLEAYDQIEAAR